MWILQVIDARENSTGDCKNPTQEIELDRDNGAGSTILMPGHSLQGTGFKAPELRDLVRTASKHLLGSFDNYTGSHPPFPHISLKTEDVTRCKMAWRALEFGKYSCSLGLQFSDFFKKSHWSCNISQRCKNWPNIDDIFELPVALGFTSAAIIYGGLHALAWFAHFESSTQQLLWRISACVVMGGFPVCWVLLKPIYYIKTSFTDSLHLDTISAGFMLTASALVALAYMLARAYLVIECFINLSHLPAGVYDVPSWASYFPHIS